MKGTTSSNEESRKKDAELIRRVGERDEKAFAELYDRFCRGLFAVAFRMVSDAKDAEDILQESFQQIWNRASTYNPALSSAFSWAVMIVWHKAVDRLRVRHRFDRTANRAAELHHFADSDATSSNLPSILERRHEVRLALEKLPKDQQEALELAFFGGLTHQEISKRLEEPLGTVKARVRRGLIRLRGLLKEEES